MKDLVKKVAVGLSTGALLANTMITPAFGAINVQVTGNGSNSDNAVSVEKANATVVEQSNTANIVNNINAGADTGNNSADDNTGGDVNIDTGDAKTQVEVVNAVNSNEASVACGGCPSDVNVVVSGNGSRSNNDVDLDLSNETFVNQTNVASISNDVDADADTGDNDADDNTGGDVSIDTGSATTLVGVKNQANANVAFVGGEGEGALELWITGNGSNSENNIGLDLSSAVVLDQLNVASIANDVDADAETGNNDAGDNTGGIVSIDTGNAKTGVLLDNMANFNLAHVEDCCELDGFIKIAGNGSDSDNDVDFGFESLLANAQDNVYGQSNDVDADADTGDNDADDNTGGVDGDPAIDTGNATTAVEAESVGNSNVFSTGDGLSDDDHGWWEDWSLEGNGNMFIWLLAGFSH